MPGDAITISLTRYAEPNALIRMTFDSLAAQQDVDADILFLDQKEDPETNTYLQSLSTPRLRFIYETIPARNLSFARNIAIEKSPNDIILFIDPDAIAAPRWAAELSSTLTGKNIGLAGGKILPIWHMPPLAIAKSGIVQDQYSILDLGDDEIPSRKMVGASFGINRKCIGKNAYFDEQFGRRPGILLGGEESDLTQRVLRQGAELWYNGRAVVQHQVLPERIRYSWIFRRIYWQGYTRAAIGGKAGGTNNSNASDYLVIPLLLPFYLMGYARARFLGKLSQQREVRDHIESQ